MNIEIRSPESEAEWEQYFQIRYTILRAPWHQPKGSERAEDDSEAIHAALFENDVIKAIGRIHLSNEKELQVRFMAVDQASRGKRYGSSILKYLEEQGIKKYNAIEQIILQARENAVDFYLRNGYELVSPSFLLFNEIQHYFMRKLISQKKN
jgi:predicted GNAT family N-acyltransferase